MLSSYVQNNYGEIFLAIMDAFKPHKVVELGCLHGYSTRYLAEGLKKNKNGIMDVFDLFEQYPFNHGTQSEVEGMLREQGLSDFVRIHNADAFGVAAQLPDNSVSLLHVDLSNTGEILKKVMEQWDSKLVQGGVILFEGGSDERDKIEWMKKYNQPSIKHELETNEIIRNKYIFGTYFKFPSLTMLLKRR